jgi:two-component system sensor kinase
VGPETDSTGALAYRVLLPAPSGEDHPGLLVAHVRLNDLLTPLLQARGAEYAVTIDWRGVRIFDRGEPLQPARDWWNAEEALTLPYDMLWRFRHEPTAELAAARLTPAPHYLLATGVALSLLLGVLAHQWRLVSRQARVLEATNQALEERGRGLEHLNLELERRVADRTERLEEVVSELEAFNYSVSHDLRSPLGAVLNLAAILAEDYAERPLGDEGLALLSRIERAALRANTLLEDLLKLSRARQAPLELDTIDMNALAREMFAQVRSAQEDDGVTLVLDELPEARGDRTLIGAVLTNLFANAFKYSRGAPKRQVSVTAQVDDDHCVYEVADTGHGFDMRFASKLFGLFERLHGDREVEGTGIGLALVARIVKRHGGRVEAEGEPGVGARFRFSLPRTPPQADVTEATDDRIH